MALSAGSDNSASMQQTLLQLRSDIRERDRKIAALEQESRPATRNGRTAESNTPRESGNSAPANGESLADLKQHNKNLLTELNNVQNKYFVIGRNYLLLKQEHERTVKELAALRKSSSAGRQP
jgi:predicted  nucleic acid-binding Zn-ribbon protein